MQEKINPNPDIPSELSETDLRSKAEVDWLLGGARGREGLRRKESSRKRTQRSESCSTTVALWAQGGRREGAGWYRFLLGKNLKNGSADGADFSGSAVA